MKSTGEVMGVSKTFAWRCEVTRSARHEAAPRPAGCCSIRNNDKARAVDVARLHWLSSKFELVATKETAAAINDRHCLRRGL
jgi:hypothetical protein